MTALLALVYLGAIVAANLLITALGPAWVIPVGLVLIGLDLAVRDKLHDRTSGRDLVVLMGLLIATGGAISYALNADAGRVAVASSVAFTLGALVDAVAYQLLKARRPWVRSAASSAPAGLVDSAAFLIILTGGLPIVLIITQAVAKALGAAAWARLLYPPARAQGITANTYDGPAGARYYRA